MKRITSSLAALMTLLLCTEVTLARDQGQWIGTWAASPTGLPTIAKIGSYAIPAPISVKGTIRYRLRISEGGDCIRLRLSNEYGSTPLAIDGVTVGLAADGLNAQPGSLKRITFSGKQSVAIPQGAPALTDAVDLEVRPLDDLLVSIYFKEGTTVFAWSEKGFALDPGLAFDVDATLLDSFPSTKKLAVRPIVSVVSVLSRSRPAVVVTLGDSITDGGLDPSTGDRGWPGLLSRRVQGQKISVVNAGIAGNRVLKPTDFMGRSALSRLDQDVFSIPGVTHLILLEGINDIGMSGQGGMLGDAPLVTADELIAAYSQIIARGRERNIKVIGATILPFEGASFFSEEKEKVRAAVNSWIRSSRAFDGVIDFDRELRDTDQPRRLKGDFDPGDHLHPNSAGYRRMADSVDFNLFN